MQRLTVPFDPKPPRKPYEYSKDGKITEESIDIRQGVCGYDYMGSAEFEFGTVAQAIRGLYTDRDKLTTFTVFVEKRDMEKSYLRRAEPKDTTFYVIGRKGDEEEITKRIRALASGTMPLQERTRIDSLYDHDSIAQVKGWLELDNGFYFFADKTMFEGTFFLFTGRSP